MKETIKMLRDSLAQIYPKGEAEAIIRIIFEYLKGWSPVDIAIHGDEELSPFIRGKVNVILERLKENEPIQYVVGQARFYGLDFKVTRDTLIPRPETEELVELVLKHCDGRADLRVLDAGTGSGCIALALARNLRFPQITAIDISEGALAVARENAARLKCRVSFRKADILKLSPCRDSWDVIVSNPPYICMSEKVGMEANVLDYEPYNALFVPDNDPMRFYTPLAQYARQSLMPEGALFFEINPLHAGQLCDMLGSLGFAGVTAHNDIHGRLRFVSAINQDTDE